MTVYRLWFLHANGRVTAVQRLHADTDKEALGIAREGLSGFNCGKVDARWTGRGSAHT